MNFKTIAIIAAISGAAIGIVYTQIHSICEDLYVRFSDIDPSIVRKAYMQFFTDAVAGRTNTDGLSESQLDALFLQYVDRQS